MTRIRRYGPWPNSWCSLPCLPAVGHRDAAYLVADDLAPEDVAAVGLGERTGR